MRRPSLLKNSSTGARNMGSRTWQEHHITQLPTEQQNAWCRLSSKHWESHLYPRPEILCMRCTMDLAETSIPVGYLRSSRSHWVLATSTSRSFLVAQFGDDTGSSCSHATLLMRTTNLVMLWTTILNCRRILPWRYRGLYHRLRDIPGPRLYRLTQSADRTNPDDRKGHLNPTLYCCWCLGCSISFSGEVLQRLFTSIRLTG